MGTNFTHDKHRSSTNKEKPWIKLRQSSHDEMLVLAGIRIKMKKHHRYTKNCTHGIVAQLLAQWDMIILQRNKVHPNFNKLFTPQGTKHAGFLERSPFLYFAMRVPHSSCYPQH